MEDKKFEDVECKDKKSLYDEAEMPEDLEKLCIQIESLVMDAYFAGRRSVEKEIQEEKEESLPICKDCVYNDTDKDRCDRFNIGIPDGCVSCEGYEEDSEECQLTCGDCAWFIKVNNAVGKCDWHSRGTIRTIYHTPCKHFKDHADKPNQEPCKLCEQCIYINETYEGYETGSVVRCTKKNGKPIDEINLVICDDFANRDEYDCTECIHYSEDTKYRFGDGEKIREQYCDAFDDTLGDTVPCYHFVENKKSEYTEDICPKCEYCHSIEDDAEIGATLYLCGYFDKKMRDISGCSAFIEGDPARKCSDCIFAIKKDDHIQCKYYSNLAIRNEGSIYCSNKVSKEYCEENNVNIPNLLTMVEAFNYFKMDGGCNRCGSQRCPANVAMLIDEAYCEAFKEWCKEEDDY